MAALDFPNGPSLGQIFTAPGGSPTYVYDGTAWVAAGQIAGPQRELFLDLSGQTQVDVVVPTWAKVAVLTGSVFQGAVNDVPALRLSGDGTTFLSGSNYNNSGPSGQTGSSLFQAWGNNTVETFMRLGVGSNSDIGSAMMFTTELNLVRPSTSQGFTSKTYFKGYDLSAANSWRAFWSSTLLGLGATSSLVLKAFRILNQPGGSAFPAGSTLHIRWLGDSGQVPISPAIAEAPMDGLVYERENGLWVPAGIRKIASGQMAAAGFLDIPFPAASGYPGGFEVLLSNIYSVAASDNLAMRFSADGTTFNSGATAYRYAATLCNDAASPTPQGMSSGPTGFNLIMCSTSLTNSAVNKCAVKLTFPSSNDGTGVMSAFWNGWSFNGTNYITFNGAGQMMSGGSGTPLAVRFLMNSGSGIAAGMRWQLNGYK